MYVCKHRDGNILILQLYSLNPRAYFSGAHILRLNWVSFLVNLNFLSQATTPTLPARLALLAWRAWPSPFPEGGIYDKGEGLEGGEK